MFHMKQFGMKRQNVSRETLKARGFYIENCFTGNNRHINCRNVSRETFCKYCGIY